MMPLHYLKGLFKSGNIREEDFVLNALELSEQKGVRVVLREMNDEQLALIETWIRRIGTNGFFLITSSGLSQEAERQRERIERVLPSVRSWLKERFTSSDSGSPGPD